MKFLTLAVTVLVAALALVAPAHAQNGAFAPYTTVGITGSGTGSVLNSTHPSGNAGIGIESSTKHLLLDVNYQAAFANGFSTGSGYTGQVTGSGYLKLGALLVGGGAYYSNQVTGFTTVQQGEEGVRTFFTGINVTQARPFLGAGLQFSRDRIIGNYILPGGFSVTNLSNLAVADRSFNVTNEIFLGKSGIKKHVRFIQTLTFNSNLTGSDQSRVDTWTGGGGLKLVL